MGHGEFSNSVGLLLNLKKRKLFLTKNDTDHFDYLLFGNFDGIAIQPVQHWYGLAPTIDMDEAAADLTDGKTELQNEPYISTYVLKLLFPRNIGDEALKGYNYAFWGETDADEKRDLLWNSAPCPFFSLIMVNVSRGLAAHFSAMDNGTKQMFEAVANQVREQVGKAFPALNCGLFESFGYYDYVMLVRTPSLQAVVNLCDVLKGLRIDGEPAVSTCYTVLGLDNWTKSGNVALPEGYHEAFEEAAKDVERIEIALQFRPGRSGRELHQVLEGGSCQIVLTEMRAHGSTDALLVMDGTQLPKLLPQYLKAGCLNPGCPEYHANVLTKNTTFLLRKQKNTGEQDEDMPHRDELVPQKYSQIFQQFRQMRSKAQKSQRLTTALRQTILRYRNLASGDHAFELHYFLQPIFNSLFENIGHAMILIDKAERDGSVWEQERLWKELECALRAFRESVGGFLSDIALSDKYFIEDSQLRHPPIGSATKLIFVYNLLVQRFAQGLNQSQCRYSFLVKSGGSDDVTVSNLFNFLPLNSPKEEGKHSENCLLVIELPERLLYTPQVALFAILHEAFHILGERNRDLRLAKMEETAADVFADLLTRVTKHFDDLKTMLFQDRDNFETAEARLDELIQQEMKRLREEAANETLHAIQDRLGALSDFDKYSRTIVDRLVDAAERCLMPDFRGQNRLFSTLYHLLCHTYQVICNRFAECEPDYVEAAFVARRMALAEKMSGDPPLPGSGGDFRITAALWEICQLSCGNIVEIKLHQESGSEGLDMLAWGHYRMRTVIPHCFKAMNEAFSDCMAIRMLNMELEDYCISHYLMEEGAIPAILAECNDTILRISCVLKVAYQVDRQLTNEQQRCIFERVEQLNKVGAFAHPMDGAGLVEWLNRLLDLCNGSGWVECIRDHVAEYLNSAVTFAAQDARERTGDILDVIVEMYGCWNPQDVGQFQRFTLDQWLRIASPRQEEVLSSGDE